MIAPEYFNNHIAVEGEIVVKRVPNDTGSVLVWNSTTKKISTRTVSEIVSDLSLMTTNTSQDVSGRKWFFTAGGSNWDNSTLGIMSQDGSNPTIAFYKGGTNIAGLNYDGGTFHFNNNGNVTDYSMIRVAGVYKNGSNDNHVLLGGGGHKSVADFVLNSSLNNYWEKYTVAGYKGVNASTPFSFLNEGEAQEAYMGGLLVSNAFQDEGLIPANGIYSKGNVISGANFTGRGLYSPILDGGQVIYAGHTDTLYFGNPSVAAFYLESAGELFHQRPGYGTGIIWTSHNFNPSKYIHIVPTPYTGSTKDLNNITESGLYQIGYDVANSGNYTGSNDGIRGLLHIETENTYSASQIQTERYSGNILSRTKMDGGWTPWIRHWGNNDFTQADIDHWNNIVVNSGNYQTLNTDQIVSASKIYYDSFPFKFKNPSYKSWAIHKPAQNNLIFAPSNSNDAEDWDWANQITLQDTGYIQANGFSKNNSDDNHILLGGGGHKIVSELATANHTHQFLQSSDSGAIDTHTTLEDYKFKFIQRVTAGDQGSTNMFPTVNNANSIIAIATHPGGYGNLLGVNGDGEWFTKNVVAGGYQPSWRQFAYRDWVTSQLNNNIGNFVPYTGAIQNVNLNDKDLDNVRNIVTNGSIVNKSIGLSVLAEAGLGGVPLIKIGARAGNMTTFTVKLYSYPYEFYEFQVNIYIYQNNVYEPTITWKSGDSAHIDKVEFFKDPSTGLFYIRPIVGLSYPRVAITDVQGYSFDLDTFNSENWGLSWDADVTPLLLQYTILSNNFKGDSRVVNTHKQQNIFARKTINKDLGTNDYIDSAQHYGQFQIGKNSDAKSLEFAVTDDGVSYIQSKEAGAGYNPLVLNYANNGGVGIGMKPILNHGLSVGTSVYSTSGFYKDGVDNNSILLGGGGHKSIYDFATSSNLNDYLRKDGGTMTGMINFANNVGGIMGNIGDNDYWRVYGNTAGSNLGYLEIATGDDGNEPIYVRQYSGVFANIVRSATILDESGNTHFPNTVYSSNGNSSEWQSAYIWGNHKAIGNNQWLGSDYVGGGNEKPNSSYFGAGKLKLQMLNGGNVSAGLGWSDVLWLSSYVGSDVKGSTALWSDKSNNRIGFTKQDYDATDWGSYYEFWTSANLPNPATQSDLSNYVPYNGSSQNIDINQKKLGNASLVQSQTFNWSGTTTTPMGKVTSESSLYNIGNWSSGVEFGYGISTNQGGGLDIMANQGGQSIRFWAGNDNDNPFYVARFYKDISSFYSSLSIDNGKEIRLKGSNDIAHSVKHFSDDYDGFAVSSGFAVKNYSTLENLFHVTGVGFGKFAQNVEAGGFLKTGSSNDYVLLGQGDHRHINNFYQNYNGTVANQSELIPNGNQWVSLGNSGNDFDGDLSNKTIEGTFANFNAYDSNSKNLGFTLFARTSTGQGIYYKTWYGGGQQEWRRLIDSKDIQSYATVNQLNGKVNSFENAYALGFSSGLSTGAPYIYHQTDGYVFLATQSFIAQNYALRAGSNATDTWVNSSNGLQSNPTIMGKMGNSGGQSNLADATWGQVAGYINTSGVSQGNPTDDWYHRIKMLHNNGAGYNGEIAVQMTGGNSLQYRRMENGVDSGWIKTWDEKNFNPLNYATQTDLLNYVSIYTPQTIIAQKVFTGGTGNNYYEAALEVRGNGSTVIPGISFHQPGLVASQIRMDASGQICIIDNPGSSYENFRAKVITGESFTSTIHGNSSQWYDAYVNNHKNYNNNQYLGSDYTGGFEKPNSAYFGGGKVKLQMLHGANVGAPDTWNDALWISSYTGADVKKSTAIISSKYSNEIGFVKADFDSSKWEKYIKFWTSDNLNPNDFATQAWVNTNFIPKSHPVYNITQANINSWNAAAGGSSHTHSNLNLLNNINQWLGVGQSPSFTNVNLMNNIGYGHLVFGEDNIGGEIGIVDLSNDRFYAGRINEYLKYGSSVNDFEGLNIHFDAKLLSIGKEITNDEDKVQLAGNISVDTTNDSGDSMQLILNPLYNTDGNVRDSRNAHIYIVTRGTVILPSKPILGQRIEIFNYSKGDIEVMHDNVGTLFILQGFEKITGIVGGKGFIFDEKPVYAKQYDI